MTSKHDGIVPDHRGDAVARWVFTGRAGGRSLAPFESRNLGSHVGDVAETVTENRAGLAADLEVTPEDMAFMHPDHGRGVALVATGSTSGIAPGAEVRDVDALVTTDAGIGLVALSADCVPCLLLDPHARVIAAVHSGWRGLLVDVAGAAIEAMSSLGAQPERMQAWLGPAICGACYPVPKDRAEAVGDVCASAVSRARDGQPALDLRRGMGTRLAGLGITVTAVGGCTAEDPSYFSHRRDGGCGRQAGAIALVGAGGSQ